jgi:hypothetical protein
MQGNEETPRAFEMPYSEGEMLSFVGSTWRSGSRPCGTVWNAPDQPSHHAMAIALHPSPTTAPLK